MLNWTSRSLKRHKHIQIVYMNNNMWGSSFSPMRMKLKVCFFLTICVVCLLLYAAIEDGCLYKSVFLTPTGTIRRHFKYKCLFVEAQRHVAVMLQSDRIHTILQDKKIHKAQWIEMILLNENFVCRLYMESIEDSITSCRRDVECIRTCNQPDEIGMFDDAKMESDVVIPRIGFILKWLLPILISINVI